MCVDDVCVSPVSLFLSEEGMASGLYVAKEKNKIEKKGLNTAPSSYYYSN